MKKPMIMGLVILFVALSIAIPYLSSFNILADNSNLAEITNQFLNQNAYGDTPERVNNIKLYDSVSIGNKKFVLAEINDDLDLGEIRLTRGINGRYKLDTVSYGGGNFRERIAEIDGKNYLLFGGRNTGLAIDKMTFKLEGWDYCLEIPAENRFFVSLEIDGAIEATHLDLEHLKFYNGKEDITEQVAW